MTTQARQGGLYVHLPFCPYICPYCDFAKWPMRRSLGKRYLAALDCEMVAAPEFKARTVFLGGGTPNTCTPEEIAMLVERLCVCFDVEEDAEITIELNPDLPLCRGFESYRAAKITRASFGVQSFEGQELATLGRRHSVEDACEAVRLARAAGFENIALDLMFGVPGQTSTTWSATLDRALSLAPTHLSAYGLTVEPDTPYAIWHAREPEAFATQDLEAELYAIAIDKLTRAGYEHYEISNFALPGYRCEHNANYWANGDYLGLGVGAASYIDGVRSVHTRDLEPYCASALLGGPVPSESERLEGPARLGEATMLALRTLEGVELSRFAERYGVEFTSYYGPVLSKMQAAGVLEVDATHVRLTSRGRFVANAVCAAFIHTG